MRIGVLSSAESWYAKHLARAASDRGLSLSRFDFAELIGKVGKEDSVACGMTADSEFDAVIVRTMPPGSLEQVVFRMDALARLEAAGTLVLNSPKALECAIDKYLTTARLAAEGLPVPETLVCESSEAAMHAFDQLGGDVVVKPLFGSEGRGLLRVSDIDLAWRTFRTLERSGSVLYLQRYVSHPGFDTRILLLGGEVISAIRRHANGSFRTNITQHGIAERHLPSDHEVHLALRAANVTGTDFAGVDLLPSDEGTQYVLEVNAVPGWRGLAKSTGIDVASRVIEFVTRNR